MATLRNKLTVIGFCAVVMLPMSIGNASAALIDSVGDQVIVNWLLPNNTNDGNGNLNNLGVDISATAVITLAAFDLSANTIDLGIKAANTTPNTANNVGLQKIGFGINPDATSVLFIDALDGEFISAQFGGFNEAPAAVDITALTGTGTPSNLQEGEMDEFVIRLGFGSLDSGFAFTLNPFAAKFQTASSSFEVLGTEGIPLEPVPEPGILGLLGIGLLGLSLSRRRLRA